MPPLLGRVAAFVLGCSLDSERRQKLLPCVEVACNTLLRILTVRSSDAYSVLSVCNALIEIAEVCSEESPVRTAVRGRFWERDVSGGDPLLPKIQAAHVSNENAQHKVSTIGTRRMAEGLSFVKALGRAVPVAEGLSVLHIGLFMFWSPTARCSRTRLGPSWSRNS